MIPLTIVEKYSEEICFMVEIDFTCILEADTPRIKLIKPMAYEMSAEVLEGFA